MDGGRPLLACTTGRISPGTQYALECGPSTTNAPPAFPLCAQLVKAPMQHAPRQMFGPGVLHGPAWRRRCAALTSRACGAVCRGTRAPARKGDADVRKFEMERETRKKAAKAIVETVSREEAADLTRLVDAVLARIASDLCMSEDGRSLVLEYVRGAVGLSIAEAIIQGVEILVGDMFDA